MSDSLTLQNKVAHSNCLSETVPGLHSSWPNALSGKICEAVSSSVLNMCQGCTDIKYCMGNLVVVTGLLLWHSLLALKV